jgi:hypothetical protein
MRELMVAGTGIRRDPEGRYCLNDLHLASGGEKKHQPANWLRNQQTKELIVELSPVPQITGTEQIQPVKIYQGGDFQGTYVVKELVYAYAAWISAAFNLKIIRAYDALAMEPAKALPRPRVERPEIEANKVFRSFFGIAKLIGLDRNQAALSANTAVKRLTGRDPLEEMEVSRLPAPVQEATMTPAELGREINLGHHHVNKRLEAMGLQKRTGMFWVVTEKGKKYSRLFDTPNKHIGGTTVTTLRWYASVIPLLEAQAAFPGDKKVAK